MAFSPPQFGKVNFPWSVAMRKPEVIKNSAANLFGLRRRSLSLDQHCVLDKRPSTSVNELYNF